MNFEILIVSLVWYISFYDTYLFPFYRFDTFVSKGIVTTRATDLPVQQLCLICQSATNYSWYLFERLTYFNFS